MNRTRHLIAASIIIALGLWTGCAHLFDRSLPLRDGAVALDGLNHPVLVSFDRLGIPHIQAHRADEKKFFSRGFRWLYYNKLFEYLRNLNI